MHTPPPSAIEPPSPASLPPPLELELLLLPLLELPLEELLPLDEPLLELPLLLELPPSWPPDELDEPPLLLDEDAPLLPELLELLPPPPSPVLLLSLLHPADVNPPITMAPAMPPRRPSVAPRSFLMTRPLSVFEGLTLTTQ